MMLATRVFYSPQLSDTRKEIAYLGEFLRRAVYITREQSNSNVRYELPTSQIPTEIIGLRQTKNEAYSNLTC